MMAASMGLGVWLLFDTRFTVIHLSSRILLAGVFLAVLSVVMFVMWLVQRANDDVRRELEAIRAESSEQISALRRAAIRAKLEALRASRRQASLEQEMKDRAAKGEPVDHMPLPKDPARSLTRSQSEGLARALDSSPASIRIVCPAGSSMEPCDFAVQLASSMRTAGWKIIALNLRAYAPSAAPSGLQIQVRSAEHPPAAALRLKEALASLDLPAKIAAGARLGWDDVVLIVGFRSSQTATGIATNLPHPPDSPEDMHQTVSL